MPDGHEGAYDGLLVTEVQGVEQGHGVVGGRDLGKGRVLFSVGEVLAYSFRSSDLVFRLGGDEFVVLIRDVMASKIDQANLMLQKPTGDLPPVSLSVGAAFGDRENPEGDIFKDANTALYRMKEGGRCGRVIH